MASQQTNQGIYRAVPIDDTIGKASSDIPSEESPSKKHPVLQVTNVSEERTSSRILDSAWRYIGHGVVDGILTFGPVFFFVIAGLCIGLHGKSVSPYGEKIKAITLLSPTIFPIIYAAILGKFLRRVGLYKVERGITIGNLERLIGCQSVFSTLERQFGLYRFDFLGFAILLAWLLSPLGGQASLRLLSTELVVTNDDNSTLLYYPVEKYIKETTLSSIFPRSAPSYPLFAPLFTTALQTSRGRLRNPMDLFGNVKIPHVDASAFSMGDDAHGEWSPIYNNTDLQYTSIFGVPTAGLPDSGNASFNLISHYWTIGCPKRPLMNNSALNNPMWQELLPSETINLKTVERLSPTFDIVVNEANSTANNISFSYQTRRDSGECCISSISCFAWIVLVESKVDCPNKACSVQAVRPVNRNISELWGGVTPLTVFKAIGKTLPGVDISITQNDTLGNELVERWVWNPDLGPEALEQGWFNLTELGTDVFRKRLMVVINTFWDSTIENIVRTEPLPMDHVLAQYNWNWTRTVMSTSKHDGLKYVCHIAFAVLTMIICALLLLAANLSLLLGIMTHTPDILGFVSISTRDNPYFDVKTSSSCSGLETARQLQHVRVKIGDVKGEEDVGHIAFTTSDKKPRRLSWTRYYD